MNGGVGAVARMIVVEIGFTCGRRYAVGGMLEGICSLARMIVLEMGFSFGVLKAVDGWWVSKYSIGNR